MDNFNQDDNTKKERAAASTTTHKHYKTKRNFKDNSANNQCLKLLDYLLEHNHITTKQAQEKLGIYYPPARVFTLRDNGYQIDLQWVIWVDEYGIKHRIGLYILKQKEPIESDKNSEVTV